MDEADESQWRGALELEERRWQEEGQWQNWLDRARKASAELKRITAEHEAITEKFHADFDSHRSF